MKALDNGPASLTAPLMNLNILLVILMSVTIYGEHIQSIEVGGIVLLITSAILVSIKLKEPLTIKEKKWFGLVVLGGLLFFFRNGGLKVTAELLLANTPILFISYLLSAIWFAIAALSNSRNFSNALHKNSVEKPLIGLHRLTVQDFYGVCSLAVSHTAAFSSTPSRYKIGRGSIVAPIFSTYGLVVVVGSVLVYKERLTLLQAIALFLLFAGLILVKL